jgi:hypothetical protein
MQVFAFAAAFFFIFLYSAIAETLCLRAHKHIFVLRIIYNINNSGLSKEGTFQN